VIEQVLWPKLKLIAAIDFRLSTTGMKSDLVLPAAGYYEKAGIKYAMALAPYVVIGERAVRPLGESKSEWEISWLLAQRIQERAIERGVEGELATLGDRFSMEGTWGPHDDEALIDHILSGSSITGGIGWEEARKAGAIPIASVGDWGPTSGIGSEVEPGVDEALPRFKPAPLPGGKHPILLSGGHTRWSIHAIWRSHPDLLRLQRGAPSMWMSEKDARERRIADGDRVRVWNDHGSFRVAARLSPAVPPGEAIIYHAWEPYQFEGWRGNMEVFSAPYKQTHFLGDYGHIRYRLFHGGPVHAARGFPVEIERDPHGAA
jgi:nitrate reductase alpha subunit